MPEPTQVMIADAGRNPPVACAHRLLEKLHDSQRERYAKITNSLRRETWLMSRAYLVDALQLRFGHCDPESIRNDTDGRIYLQNHPIWVSMSHSRRMIVISMSDVRAGVDVEYAKMRNIVRQGSRIFSDPENAYLGALNEGDRLQAFYTYWTLKEAACKAAGLPLLACLQDFRFELQNGGFQVPPSVNGQTLYFESTCINKNWRVALALIAGSGIPAIEYREWTASRQWQRLKPDLRAYRPSVSTRRANQGLATSAANG